MGFFDVLKDGAKKLSDRVTGGYGEIVFNIGKTEVRPGDGLPVRVDLKARGELKAEKIVIRLRGREKCTMEISYRDSNAILRKKRDTQTNYTGVTEFDLCGSFEMNEGETDDVKGMIQIPQNCQPTYYGVLSEHRWIVEAEVIIPWGKNLFGSKEVIVR